jgi:tripartite-type tricarboxylate transporter receptor subunit TctC
VKRFIAILAVLAVTLAGFGFAQDYPWQPERPITIIVPWGAGGSTDTVTRVLAAELEAELGQPVVIVNQPGASGSIGTTNALTADNDCYTWAAGAAQDLGTYGVLDMLDTSLADWHLYLTVANTAVVGVNANTPYQTFPELVDAMRARPGEIPVATAGQTSAGHNAMELIAQALDLSYRHVTYEGGNPAVIATVGGETELTTQLAVEQAEMIRGGRIRPLAAVSKSSLELDGFGTIPSISEWIPDLDDPGQLLRHLDPARRPRGLRADLRHGLGQRDRRQRGAPALRERARRALRAVARPGGRGPRHGGGPRQRVDPLRRRQGRRRPVHPRHRAPVGARDPGRSSSCRVRPRPAGRTSSPRWC